MTIRRRRLFRRPPAPPTVATTSPPATDRHGQAAEAVARIRRRHTDGIARRAWAVFDTEGDQ